MSNYDNAKAEHTEVVNGCLVFGWICIFVLLLVPLFSAVSDRSDYAKEAEEYKLSTCFHTQNNCTMIEYPRMQCSVYTHRDNTTKVLPMYVWCPAKVYLDNCTSYFAQFTYEFKCYEVDDAAQLPYNGDLAFEKLDGVNHGIILLCCVVGAWILLLIAVCVCYYKTCNCDDEERSYKLVNA